MTGTTTTRIIAMVLAVASSAFCQPPHKQNTLPDAPTPQSVNQDNTFRAFLNTVRLPATTPVASQAFRLRYDPLHIQDERKQTGPADLTSWHPSLLKPGPAFHGSTSNSLLGRATDAASSIVLTRDEEGNRKLNTQYLLRVLTVATAHVADRQYGRRTLGQPLSDFGSTVGNDAGLNVLHEFQPGLLELVRSHEPRFVSRIEHRVRQK